jgi:hypothetical protein
MPGWQVVVTCHHYSIASNIEEMPWWVSGFEGAGPYHSEPEIISSTILRLLYFQGHCATSSIPTLHGVGVTCASLSIASNTNPGETWWSFQLPEAWPITTLPDQIISQQSQIPSGISGLLCGH